MENYNYETLSSLVGEPVAVRDSQGNTAELVISEVHRSSLDGPEWEAFSVIYTGSPQIRIPEGSYFVSHPGFGELQLFISPKSETEYETAVTRERQ